MLKKIVLLVASSFTILSVCHGMIDVPPYPEIPQLPEYEFFSPAVGDWLVNRGYPIDFIIGAINKTKDEDQLRVLKVLLLAEIRAVERLVLIDTCGDRKLCKYNQYCTNGEDLTILRELAQAEEIANE